MAVSFASLASVSSRVAPRRQFSSAASPAPAPTPAFGQARFNVYQTTTNDPFFNIAFEEHLFNQHAPTAHTLFLWRNKPSVIIGRFQNPHKECFVSRLEEDKVELVRRKSGGGAVYQDLNNSIFTFISPASIVQAERQAATARNNAILISALKSLGVEGVPSGRNDITVNGKKVSGSAFKFERGLFLHHGTMMLGVDFTALSRYLNPNKAKLLSKGVQSVVARVMNLNELLPGVSHEVWCDALVKAFAAHHPESTLQGPLAVQTVDHAALAGRPELASIYDSLKDWNWRFGQTPQFTYNIETRFEWGIMDVHINSSKGVVDAVQIFSDSLHPQMIEKLMQALHGVPYTKSAFSDALAQVRTHFAGSPPEQCVAEFHDWLLANM